MLAKLGNTNFDFVLRKPNQANNKIIYLFLP